MRSGLFAWGLLFFQLALFAERIDQTKQSVHLKEIREELQASYRIASDLDPKDIAAHQKLLEKVNLLKKNLKQEEEKWKLNSPQSNQEYAFFDQDETTVAQLIAEYGSQDFLYIIPPEVGAMKVSMQSAVAIPRESWSEMIEMILQLNGVGSHEINPFAKQLFLLKQDLLAVQAITSTKEQIQALSPSTRVIHIFSPPVEHLRSAFYFFERFRDLKRTFVYQVGAKIAIVGTPEDVLRFLGMYEQAFDGESDKLSCVVTLTKLSLDEARLLLRSYFGSLGDTAQPVMGKNPVDLSLMPIGAEKSLLLVGAKSLVEKAKELIAETEGQMEHPSEMTLFWYRCRHSEPKDLADVLEQVYTSLIGSDMSEAMPKIPYGLEGAKEGDERQPFFERGSLQDSTSLPGKKGKHFIPYGKAGGVMMVVRKDSLPKLKELLIKLDVPKKMVHLEVILCEKRLLQQTHSGLNLLKVGSDASGRTTMGSNFFNQEGTNARGIFQFFLNRPKSSNLPAFDMTHNFLMNQEDIRISSSPSVMTMNQTPATIAVVEEISINNGAAPISSNDGVVFERSYSRAEYGTKIVITPTIHEPDELDQEDRPFITLETNITFDTIDPDLENRPVVHRRRLENHVRIPDGETVVLGGLKRKNSQDHSEKIPLLGEVPGLGKLFGATQLKDQLTDMYVFITPRVLLDPLSDLQKIRKEKLEQRPGDIPLFLQAKKEAKEKKKMKWFEQTVKLLMGNDREVIQPGIN